MIAFKYKTVLTRYTIATTPQYPHLPINENRKASLNMLLLHVVQQVAQVPLVAFLFTKSDIKTTVIPIVGPYSPEFQRTAVDVNTKS